MLDQDRLLEKSVSEKSVRPDLSNKNYTNPQTYGVYEILKTNDSKKFRFGNHPVRENELMREFDSNVKRVGLFLDREDAKKLVSYLNS